MNIPRRLDRTYNECPHHLCKVMTAFIPSPPKGSRYVHFCPLGMLDTELVMEGDFRVFGLWYQGVAKRPIHPTPLFPRCLQPFTLMRYVHETFSVRLSVVRVSFPFLLLWGC